MADELPVQTKSEGLVERAKGMLVRPSAEWPRVAAETTEPMKVLTNYVIPLALIGPIASLIGMQLFGINVLFTTVTPSIGTSLGIAITSFVMTLVGVFVLAFIANWLSPKFGGKDDFPAAFRLVAYAMTASWIGGIFGLIPSLAIIGLLFGLYTLYVLYLGTSPVMAVPKDKQLTYTVVTILAAIVLYIVVGMVTAAVTGTMGLATTGAAVAASEQATIDLGELGRVDVNGDTATLTVDGEEVQVDLEAMQAQAEAAAAKAKAAE
jgi:hypothetical protein